MAAKSTRQEEADLVLLAEVLDVVRDRPRVVVDHERVVAHLPRERDVYIYREGGMEKEREREREREGERVKEKEMGGEREREREGRRGRERARARERERERESARG